MNNLNQKIIAIVFLIVIAIFGLGTFYKSKDQGKAIFSEYKYSDLPQMIEVCIQESFYRHNDWIDLNGVFQRIIGVKVMRDAGDINVYKLSNGQIMYSCQKTNTKIFARQVEDFKSYLDSKGIETLYVQLPFKIESSEKMPLGTEDFGNQNGIEMTQLLSEKGIYNINLYEELKKEKGNYSSYFFNTDQHWKPATALWGAGEISRHLKESFDVDIEMKLFDKNLYFIKKYKNWFLGSLGKRAGKYYAGIDDFDVFLPKFKTALIFEADTSQGKIKREGSFQQSMYEWSYIEKKDLFSLNTYAGYTGGDYGFSRTINKKSKNKYRILLIRDSFSCTLAPFLSLSCERLDTIDMRHYKGKIEDYIQSENPDIVIIAYNPSAFTEKQFKFI